MQPLGQPDCVGIMLHGLDNINKNNGTIVTSLTLGFVKFNKYDSRNQIDNDKGTKKNQQDEVDLMKWARRVDTIKHDITPAFERDADEDRQPGHQDVVKRGHSV